MKRKVGSMWGMSRQQIDLMSRLVKSAQSTTNEPTIMVSLNGFSKCTCTLKFKHNSSDYKWIDVNSVTSIVPSSYNAK